MTTQMVRKQIYIQKRQAALLKLNMPSEYEHAILFAPADELLVAGLVVVGVLGGFKPQQLHDRRSFLDRGGPARRRQPVLQRLGDGALRREQGRRGSDESVHNDNHRAGGGERAAAERAGEVSPAAAGPHRSGLPIRSGRGDRAAHR